MYGFAGDALGWHCEEYNTETRPRSQRSSPRPFPSPRDPCSGELRAHLAAAAAQSPRWAASACAGGGHRHPDSFRCHCRRQRMRHPEADTRGMRGKGPGRESPRIQGLVSRVPKRPKRSSTLCNQETHH